MTLFAITLLAPVHTTRPYYYFPFCMTAPIPFSLHSPSSSFAAQSLQSSTSNSCAHWHSGSNLHDTHGPLALFNNAGFRSCSNCFAAHCNVFSFIAFSSKCQCRCQFAGGKHPRKISNSFLSFSLHCFARLHGVSHLKYSFRLLSALSQCSHGLFIPLLHLLNLLQTP